MDLAALGPGVHLQRMDDRSFGADDAGDQIVLVVVVHQEADRAAVHAVHRGPATQIGVQGLQHMSIAAQGHDDVGLMLGRRAVACDQRLAGCLGLGAVGGDEGQDGIGRDLVHGRT